MRAPRLGLFFMLKRINPFIALFLVLCLMADSLQASPDAWRASMMQQPAAMSIFSRQALVPPSWVSRPVRIIQQAADRFREAQRGRPFAILRKTLNYLDALAGSGLFPHLPLPLGLMVMQPGQHGEVGWFVIFRDALSKIPSRPITIASKPEVHTFADLIPANALARLLDAVAAENEIDPSLPSEEIERQAMDQAKHTMNSSQLQQLLIVPDADRKLLMAAIQEALMLAIQEAIWIAIVQYHDSERAREDMAHRDASGTILPARFQLKRRGRIGFEDVESGLYHWVLWNLESTIKLAPETSPLRTYNRVALVEGIATGLAAVRYLRSEHRPVTRSQVLGIVSQYEHTAEPSETQAPLVEEAVTQVLFPEPDNESILAPVWNRLESLEADYEIELYGHEEGVRLHAPWSDEAKEDAYQKLVAVSHNLRGVFASCGMTLEIMAKLLCHLGEDPELMRQLHVPRADEPSRPLVIVPGKPGRPAATNAFRLLQDRMNDLFRVARELEDEVFDPTNQGQWASLTLLLPAIRGLVGDLRILAGFLQKNLGEHGENFPTDVANMPAAGRKFLTFMTGMDDLSRDAEKQLRMVFYPVENEPIDVSKAVAEAKPPVGLQKTMDAEANLPQAHFNSLVLSQIVVPNLLRNAQHAGAKAAICQLRAIPGWLLFSVIDDGQGVPPEHQDILYFDATSGMQTLFTRRSTRGKGSKGSGAGSTSVYRFISRAGGLAYAGNVAPHGLAVTVALPVEGEVVMDRTVLDRRIKALFMLGITPQAAEHAHLLALDAAAFTVFLQQHPPLLPAPNTAELSPEGGGPVAGMFYGTDSADRVVEADALLKKAEARLERLKEEQRVLPRTWVHKQVGLRKAIANAEVKIETAQRNLHEAHRALAEDEQPHFSPIFEVLLEAIRKGTFVGYSEFMAAPMNFSDIAKTITDHFDAWMMHHRFQVYDLVNREWVHFVKDKHLKPLQRLYGLIVKAMWLELEKLEGQPVDEGLFRQRADTAGAQVHLDWNLNRANQIAGMQGRRRAAPPAAAPAIAEGESRERGGQGLPTEILRQALLATRDKLESVAHEGIISAEDQRVHELPVSESAHYPSEHQQRRSPFIAVNVLVLGQSNKNKRVAEEALLHRAKGSLQVMMERDWDTGIGLTDRMPQQKAEELLRDRAQFGIIALLDIANIPWEDRKALEHSTYIRAPGVYEFPLFGPLSTDSIQALLVPETLVQLAREIFPSKQIIPVPDRAKETLSISRPFPKGPPREWKWKRRNVDVQLPDFQTALMKYLDAQPFGHRLLIHGIRLVATTDVLFKSEQNSPTTAPGSPNSLVYTALNRFVPGWSARHPNWLKGLGMAGAVGEALLFVALAPILGIWMVPLLGGWIATEMALLYGAPSIARGQPLVRLRSPLAQRVLSGVEGPPTWKEIAKIAVVKAVSFLPYILAATSYSPTHSFGSTLLWAAPAHLLFDYRQLFKGSDPTEQTTGSIVPGHIPPGVAVSQMPQQIAAMGQTRKTKPVAPLGLTPSFRSYLTGFLALVMTVLGAVGPAKATVVPNASRQAALSARAEQQPPAPTSQRPVASPSSGKTLEELKDRVRSAANNVEGLSAVLARPVVQQHPQAMELLAWAAEEHESLLARLEAVELLAAIGSEEAAQVLDRVADNDSMEFIQARAEAYAQYVRLPEEHRLRLTESEIRGMAQDAVYRHIPGSWIERALAEFSESHAARVREHQEEVIIAITEFLTMLQPEGEALPEAGGGAVTPPAPWAHPAPAGVPKKPASDLLVWRIPMGKPPSWWSGIRRDAVQWGVDPELAYAVLRKENAPLDPNAMSPAGIGRGLFQIERPAWDFMRHIYRVRVPGLAGKVWDYERAWKYPAKNRLIAILYLRWLADVFEGRVDHILAAYNGGPTRLLRGQLTDDARAYAEVAGKYYQELKARQMKIIFKGPAIGIQARARQKIPKQILAGHPPTPKVHHRTTPPTKVVMRVIPLALLLLPLLGHIASASIGPSQEMPNWLAMMMGWPSWVLWASVLAALVSVEISGRWRATAPAISPQSRSVTSPSRPIALGTPPAEAFKSAGIQRTWLDIAQEKWSSAAKTVGLLLGALPLYGFTIGDLGLTIIIASGLVAVVVGTAYLLSRPLLKPALAVVAPTDQKSFRAYLGGIFTRGPVILGAVILLLDQLSKVLVRWSLPVGAVGQNRKVVWFDPHPHVVTLIGHLAIAHVEDIFTFGYQLLALIGGVGLLFQTYRLLREDYLSLKEGRNSVSRIKASRGDLALSVGFAGAIGNSIDVLFRGSITDYLCSDWPYSVINIADLSMFLGLILGGAAYLLDAKRSRDGHNRDQSGPGAPTSITTGGQGTLTGKTEFPGQSKKSADRLFAKAA